MSFKFTFSEFLIKFSKVVFVCWFLTYIIYEELYNSLFSPIHYFCPFFRTALFESIQFALLYLLKEAFNIEFFLFPL